MQELLLMYRECMWKLRPDRGQGAGALDEFFYPRRHLYFDRDQKAQGEHETGAYRLLADR